MFEPVLYTENKEKRAKLLLADFRPIPCAASAQQYDQVIHCSHSGLVGQKLSRLYTQYCEEYIYIVRLHGCAGRSESFPGRIYIPDETFSRVSSKILS